MFPSIVRTRVNSMKQMYKKVTLISFSIEPVLRYQCVFFCFWQMLNLQKSPPLPSAKNLLHGYTHNNMHISKDGAIADGGFFVLSYGKFLLQSRLSDSVEQYNEPPRYRLRRNFAGKINFLWFISTRRIPGAETVLVLQT